MLSVFIDVLKIRFGMGKQREKLGLSLETSLAFLEETLSELIFAVFGSAQQSDSRVYFSLLS